jgi:DNA-binding CsgD family transcriptional regulator
MDALDTADVARLLRLLAEAGDPSSDISIPERKRMLMAGLADVIEADVWLWITGVANPSEQPGDTMATNIIDGGWRSSAEKHSVLSLLTDPKTAEQIQGGLVSLFLKGRVVTVGRDATFHPEHRENALKMWTDTGFGDALMTVYPLGPHAYSAIGIHRRADRPPFGDRERTIVQLIFEQVDWLHRHGLDVPASDKVLQLSPRQRQVLLLLLGGDSQRQVARAMGLSEHTVGDYVKQLYRRFEVSSRGELFSHFMTGGGTQ